MEGADFGEEKPMGMKGSRHAIYKNSKKRGTDMSILGRRQRQCFGAGNARIAEVVKAAVLLSLAAFFLFFIFAVDVQKATAEDCECKICHGPQGPHSGGYPGCDACHGNPPVNSSGVVWFPSPTGATSAGAHSKHATSSGYNYSCDTCHSNGMPITLIGEDPPLLQMGFSLFTGNDTYDGRVLQSPYAYDATNGTTVTTNGSMTCSSIYCHSDGTSVTTGATPAGISPSWTTAVPLACSGCHGYPPSYAQDQPKSNTHVFHVSSMRLTCNVCHFSTTADGVTITDVTKHANSQYNVTPDPNVLFGGNPVAFTYSYDPGGGRCTNVSCHGPKTWGNVELTAGVGWAAGPTCFEVDFTGYLNGTPPQSFSWNFGDGQIGEGENITHYYAHAGTYPVQLSAIDANRHSASTVANVIVQQTNLLPVPDRTVTVSGYTVTVTDYSTDPDYNTCDHSGPGTLLVQWGATGVPDTQMSVDLTNTRPAVGRSVSHTYSTSGTFVVKHAVKDNFPSGFVYSNNISVTVPSKFIVSGRVTRSNGTTPISGVTLFLRSSSKSFSTSTQTDGTYTFTNVVPDTYSITASKVGYTFNNPAVTGIVVTTSDVTGVNRIRR